VNHVVAAAALAFSAGTVSFTVSTAKISVPLRMWLHHRTSAFGRWVFELVSCVFCLGMWLNLAAAGVYRPWLVQLWWPLDWVVTGTAMTGISMIPVLIIKKGLAKP
jgi:hypothetical protein